MASPVESLSSDAPLSRRARWAAGQPISELMSRALAHPDLISLAAGFVDNDSLPVDITRRAMEHLLADPMSARAALQYGTTPGFPDLREYLRQQAAAEGAAVETADEVVVTAGSNQLLHLVAETLLDPGDIVLCAAPTYFVFLGTLANLGAEAIGVETDEHGILPDALEESWNRLVAEGRDHRVKAVYIVPYFDNPRGTTMSLERRGRIVELAKRFSSGSSVNHRVHVLSDEAYRELRYDGADIPSTLVLDPQRDTVIMARTFAKSFAPGIRVGWGILPPNLVEPVCHQKGNSDFGSPNFNQHLMATILRNDWFHGHVESLRRQYSSKRETMLRALDEHAWDLPGVHWDRPGGGLYVWLHLPPEIDAGIQGTLFERAIQRGVLYVPGEYCFARSGAPVRKNTIRLSFGVQTHDNIEKGIKILATAIREALSTAAEMPPAGNSTTSTAG